MNYPLCRHIRVNGLQCRAAALTGTIHCFFHTKLYQRHSAFRPPVSKPGDPMPATHIRLLPLEDAESIQVAFSTIINALASGQLETGRATALLYGLQMASSNIGRLNPYVSPNIVRSVESTPDGLELAPRPVYQPC